MKRFLITGLIALTLAVGSMAFVPRSAHAAGTVEAACDKSGSFLGFPTWYKFLDVKLVNGSCDVQLTKDASGKTDTKAAASKILLAVFEIMLRVSGLAAVALVMWGGFKYQISQGSSDEVSKAKSTIINAMIGVAITLSATIVVNLIGKSL